MDLCGTWRAAVVPTGRPSASPAFAAPDFDDRAWAELPVPGHWRSSPPFAASDGPVALRRRFAAPRPGDGRRAWLRLDGVFYRSRVWLDGDLLGATEGYFFPHHFEVTAQLRARSEHVVVVEAACERLVDLRAKRAFTGVFQHWDCLDPEWNPGGIWRPVGVDVTGPVRLTRLRLLCRSADEHQAVVALTARLDAAEATGVTVRTTVAGVEHVLRHHVRAGGDELRWTVAVDRPPLWWPHALGPPTTVEAAVEVGADGHDGASDRRVLRTGLRQVRLRDWVLRVNGERLFVKGANQGPTRMALGEAAASELEADVALAKSAGLDLLRAHGHVSRPELYEAADRHGVLVWQDLPLQWGYARGTAREAARQAVAAVDLLGHHPSVALWCGHNEPFAWDVSPGAEPASPLAQGLRFAAGQALPSWNKTVLDAAVARALRSADPSRPVRPHSGVLGNDTHAYFGWYHGSERDVPQLSRWLPRLARFVSEFGAQAVPASDDFLEPERWPDLDWARLRRRHALQLEMFERNGLAPSRFATFEEWRAASQAHQADVVRFTVETLRRLKYRPTGGFCQFSLADGHPGVTWSVLDHERQPKAGWAALVAACAPVVVVADRPAP
ncbi:MAG: hypothetical protein M3Q48_05895, partial [Actinomycetota bacterium]|nr:hypothetical protein [Actinomycetota bacterium]